MAVPPNLLVLDVGVNPNQVRRLAGGTSLSAIGGGLTSQDEYNAQVSGNNRVVQYRRSLIAHSGRGFDLGIHYFHYGFETNVWSDIGTILTGAGGVGNTLRGSGCHVLNGPSGQVAGGLMSGNGSAAIVVWTWNGTSFVQTALGSGHSNGLGRSLKWRNVVYQLAHVSLVSGDPIGGTATSYAPGWTSSNVAQGGICAFRDRLFVLRHPAVSTAPTLYELTGGSLVSLGTMPGAGAGTSLTMLDSCNHALFPLGNTEMVAVYMSSDGTNHGTRAARIIPSGGGFTFTDITTAIVPAALQPSAVAAKELHAWEVFVDNDTDPTTPAVYLWHKTTLALGGAGSYYEFVNVASTLGPGTASAGGGILLASSTVGGGERVNFDSTPPGTDFQAITNLGPVGILGGVRLSFRASGDTSASAGRRTDVNYATIAPLPAYGVTGGPGVGSTLTASANGPLSVDGASPVVGNRILVKDEASAQRNGLYSVSDAGSGGSPFILIRATDFDQASPTEVAAGAWCRVLSGGSLSTTYWQMSQTAAITMDTTALTWAQLSTRFARVFNNTLGNTDMAQGSLQGTPTGLPWVVRNVNVIEGIIADDNTVYTLDWSTVAGPNTYVIRIGVS